jgi:hypothetical protein
MNTSIEIIIIIIIIIKKTYFFLIINVKNLRTLNVSHIKAFEFIINLNNQLLLLIVKINAECI